MKASDASVLKLAYDAYRAERERHAPVFEVRAQRIHSKLVRTTRGRRIGPPLISAFALLLAGAAYAAQGFPDSTPTLEVRELAPNDLHGVLTATSSNIARILGSPHSNSWGDLGFVDPIELPTNETRQPHLHPDELRGLQRPLPAGALSTAGGHQLTPGNDEAERSPQVKQELEAEVPNPSVDEWRHVADALSNGDEGVARAALTRLAENEDASIRAKALLGMLQLELTHHRCERVAGLARDVEDVVGPGHKLTRHARRLSNQCGSARR